MDQFVMPDLSHLSGPAYCVYQIHYVCDVRNYLLQSGRGGKTSQRQARQNHISLWGARGLFIPVQVVLFWSTTWVWTNLCIREGFGGLCARQRCSTCPGEHDMCCAGLCLYCVWYFFLYVRMYVSVCNFSELVCALLSRRLFDDLC